MKPRIGLVIGAVLALVLLIWIVQPAGLAIFGPRDWTWQAIQQRGKWRVGLDPSFPPFDLLDANGQPAGFDVDLARAMASGWGVEVEFVALGFDSLYDAVRTGQIDSVVSAYPYDERLTRDVRFSSSYFEAGIQLVVRQTATVQTTADLAGKTVAIEWGSLGDMIGRNLQREDATIQLAQFATPAEALAALAEDESITAALVDNVTLRQAQGQGLALKAVGPVLESNPYVIVVPYTAVTLADQIEQGLEAIQANGTIAALEAKWFSSSNNY